MKKNNMLTTFISTILLAGLMTVTGGTNVIASQDNQNIPVPAQSGLGPVQQTKVEYIRSWNLDSNEMQATYSVSEAEYEDVPHVQEAIRQALINREETLTVNLNESALEGVTKDTVVDYGMKIVDDAVKHITCGEAGYNSKLGDYYDKTRGGYNVGASYYNSGSKIVKAIYTYTFKYYTNKEQEDFVDNRLKNEIYPELNLSDTSLTDEQKICKIYTWIVNNISYDYDNLNDDSNFTKYTAYGALHDSKAVCQGFAVLFYRMCMDNGIDCRIVTGTANGGPHAWNIVNVNEKYYYLDATWDCKVLADDSYSGKAGTYFYFLRNMLSDHTLNSDSNKIIDMYTMSDDSISAITAQVDTQGKTYLSSQDVTLKDICGNVLTSDQKKWYKVTVSAGDSSCKWNVKVGSNAVGMEDLIFEDKTVYTHTDSDNDGKCDICKQFINGIGERLAGYSLSLSGNIGVKFYMELSDDIKNDKDAYMLFTLPDETNAKVYINAPGNNSDGSSGNSNEQGRVYATTSEVDGTTYYVFTCEVAAKEMTADIKAQIISGSENGTIYTYTVKEYADYILSHPLDENTGKGYDENTVSLVKAMLNYGSYAQEYFAYRTQNPANADLTQAERNTIDLVDSDKFLSNVIKITGDKDVCTFESAFLSLKSQTDICVYVKLASGMNASDVTFKVDDEIINTSDIATVKVGEDNCYKLTVNGILAHNLADMHTFAVIYNSGANTKVATLSYGAFSYCNIALSEKFDDLANIAQLRNVLKAMYLYNKAAINYVN